MGIMDRVRTLLYGDFIRFDLETTGLRGKRDKILSASFKRNGLIYSFRSEGDEADLALSIRDELESGDYIVGWNSLRFDVPFLNARLRAHGDRPLRAREVDAMLVDIRVNRLPKRRSLVDAANFYRVTDEYVHKTPIDWDIWKFAEMGNVDCMDYVVDHCEKDVELLDRVYSRLRRAK